MSDEQPTRPLDTASPPDADALAGHPRHIADYEVLELIGEGGMGRVYRARQANPSREVALKLVRGLGRDALARFQRESELLAALEHPGIARLYAAGEADFAGMRLPWLAMEYVRGRDLVSHAQQHELGLRQRVALLVSLCRAVQHAHARGIIHRDLKPANVLVDDDGRIRVLDFGIARLRGEEGQVTHAGQVLGTLPYMSPEQLSGDNRGVDVRSDVYALGVIAYELLSGRLPHPRLSTSTLFEALDVVRRETPPALAALQPRARGDLDRVVMKALASEPARRYDSAAAFADDLQRVLDHRPVEARAPTLAYVLGRFARRHRALSAAILVVAAVLVAATAVSLRFAIAEAEARREAEARAAESEATIAFLQDMLSAADPELARGEDLRVSELLDQAEASRGAQQAPAAVDLAILETLAVTRASLGQFARALEINDEALALARASGAPAATEAWLLRRRGSLYTELGETEAGRAALEEAGRADPSPRPVARLGLVLTRARLEDEAGNTDEAESGYREVLAGARGLDPGADEAEELARVVDVARSNLSGLLLQRGVLEEGLALAREVHHQRHERFGERDPRTLAARHKLALGLAAMGEREQALAESQAVLALQREVLGDEHASTMTTMQTVANTLLELRRLDEAESLTREALERWSSQFGDTHLQTIASRNALAYLLEERGQRAEAEQQYRLMLAAVEAGDGPQPGALVPRNNLGLLLVDDGRAAQAVAEFERLLADADALVGRNHLLHAIFSSNHGQALVEAGRPAEAAKVLEDARERLVGLVGAEHERSRTAAERLARAYRALGREAEANALEAPAP